MPEGAGLRPGERLRLEAAIAAGLEGARETGGSAPRLRDAVWTLLLEAGDTLRRLPNRERGWLTAASRSHWPDYLRSAAEELAGGAAAARTAPAQPAAIDRLDTVLAWLAYVGGPRQQRDQAILFGLACGVKVAALRQRFGCGRRTVYDARDRAIARICGRLRDQSDICRRLP
jgi:Domain of unknown function (DUF6362)